MADQTLAPGEFPVAGKFSLDDAGRMAWLSKYLPGRRLIAAICLWVVSLFLAAYAGGYRALRQAEVFTFEYPIEFLDRYLNIKNPNPTLTRNNAGSYDPVAEVRDGWVVPLPIGAGDTWPGTKLVKFYSPLIWLESRDQKNVVTDDMENISGVLSAHTCEAALSALLFRDTGIDANISSGSGNYWHHESDFRGVKLHGTLQGIDIPTLIAGFKANPDYVIVKLESEEDFKRYGGGHGFTTSPAYHFGSKWNDFEDSESYQGWVVIDGHDWVSIRYGDTYTDS